MCVDWVCVDSVCVDRVCVDRVCIDNVCVERVCVLIGCVLIGCVLTHRCDRSTVVRSPLSCDSAVWILPFPDVPLLLMDHRIG